VDGSRQRNHLYAVSAADARHRADRAGARRRTLVGVTGTDGRASTADQGKGADQPVSRARGGLAKPEVSVLLFTAPARRRGQKSRDDALQPGAAAEKRPELDRRARGRNG